MPTASGVFLVFLGVVTRVRTSEETSASPRFPAVPSPEWDEIFCRNGGHYLRGNLGPLHLNIHCKCPFGFGGSQCQDWTCHQGGVCNGSALLDLKSNQTCEVEARSLGAESGLTYCAMRCQGACPNVTPRDYCRVEGTVKQPCICPSGVEGPFCTEATECEQGSLVRNGKSNQKISGIGVCRSDEFQTVCLCNKGYTGPKCEVLDHSQCGVRGHMQKNGTCWCREPFFGDRCQNFCENKGLLFEDVVDVNGTVEVRKKCVCSKDYYGEFCHMAARRGMGQLSTLALCLIITLPLTLQAIILVLIFYHFKRKRSEREIAAAVETALELQQIPPQSPQDMLSSLQLEMSQIRTLPDLLQTPGGVIPPLPSYEEVMGATEYLGPRISELPPDEDSPS